MIKPPIFEPYANFLALPEQSSSWENSRAVIISAPFDGTTSFKKGTSEGPRAIIAASQQVELYDAEFDGEPAFDIGIHTLPSLEPVCSTTEAMIDRVEKAFRFVLDAGKFPMMFGGEHSVTVGAARAFKEKMGEIGFVVIDAHADLRESYHDTPLSHACASRRLWELGPVVQVGIRSLSVQEAEWQKSGPEGYRCFPGCEVLSCLDEFEVSLKDLPEKVYVSIDLDGLDPSIMPAVGTPEPGGLSWQDTLTVLRRVCDLKRVAGFDAVELCPIPGVIAPDFLAAKLTYKLLGYAHA